ncbi:MAG: bacteriocin immunity protein [Lactobacillus sp.]|nr:bacteriocin immunity protein [Lactobacillus sp.]
MFGKERITDQDILDLFYDYVLDPTISDRERKIGLMAKADLEKGRYNVAIVNKVLVSLQKEAMKTGLTPAASQFYDVLEPILIKIKPIGTNLGSLLLQNSYLD